MSLDDFNFDPELSKAATLPARWYRDPSILALEQTRVFGSFWQHVGRTDQLARPGDFLTCTVGEEPMIVVRDAGGNLRAFSNVCRHRAGPVARGCGNRKSFQCAYHGWTYDLEGRLTRTLEFEEVQNFDRATTALPSARVGVWGPLVFVARDPDAPPFEELMGAIPSETEPYRYHTMRYYKRVVFDLECNWKVYVDNYLEGYHIPIVHPGLFKEIDYEHYRVLTKRWYSRQDSPIRKADSLYLRNLPDGEAPQALYYWIFPNLMLNLYPDNMQTNVILPLGPERTRTVFEWYFDDPARPGLDAEFEKTYAFSESVQAEDIAICEDVQRGLRSSTYSTGRYSVKRENGVHHFHGLLARQLRATR